VALNLFLCSSALPVYLQIFNFYFTMELETYCWTYHFNDSFVL